MDKMDAINLDNQEKSVAKAIAKVDGYLDNQNLEKKQKLHLRLLSEEAIGMVRAMTGEFKAQFWIEEEKGEYKVHVLVKTEMSREKKNEILSASKSGKNVFAKGFMGKVRDIVENCLLNFDEALELQQEYGSSFVDYGLMGGMPGELTSSNALRSQALIWSLRTYKENLEQQQEKPMAEEWDELEKSVVASIAKDVVIGVRKDSVDITISL
ncbi:MAG: hypothetical protein E7277_08245 [Lachnospiraceae bacterium]|jgi:hypothetical protein|nr:hypothetical protein [Lachnospiraceae bacterium]